MPLAHDGVPRLIEHAIRFEHVVPQAVGTFKLVSQPVPTVLSQSPKPTAQPAIPHTPALHDGVPLLTWQGIGLPQSPVGVQVWTDVFEQRLAGSLQATHLPFKQAPEPQSPSAPQASPSAQSAAQLPPQSLPVSLPFFTPSVHVAAMHWLPEQRPLAGSAQSVLLRQR